ncbi:rRNA maturation RNase YbeY [Heliophilum fasciatum]|uniref:Endoribonuclease YbeY n=1 Tax=Heliophilum fasciatum TaxID=35700 RepID=A0A4R2RK10_9FIRM|nr:rRNA maturation RNase YbeY [Heliophilum fasciatum]MCW2278142.1 putative rRNA maturation factor [Heliophilum fasciatum]TCP64212.1 putative rRNA maturation factor [Heliophilum fasciatum]
MELYIVDERDVNMTEEEVEAWQEMLEQLALLCLEEVGYPPEDAEISLLLTTDQGIAVLNQQYRGMEGPTDVLSFAMREMGEGEELFDIDELNEDDMLGDIVISIDTAMRQAEEYGHPLEREVGFLFVHGLLHLLGYDHKGEEDTELMQGLERKVLSSYGLTRE